MARTSTKEIERARAWLTKQSLELAGLATEVEELAWALHSTKQEQNRELLAHFHNRADKLPYVYDSDFGALVLECVGDSVFGFGKRKSKTQALHRSPVAGARLRSGRFSGWRGAGTSASPKEDR